MIALQKDGASIPATKQLPAQDILRELLDYDPQTGIFKWKARGPHLFRFTRQFITWNERNVGTEALNSVHRGKLYGKVAGEQYFAHRIAWKYVYGTDPEFIDHINGNTQDNRIANLRSVDVATNNRNMSKPKRNKSGFIGVRKSDKSDRWAAFITYEGKRINLGTFDSKADAVAARVEAEVKFGFHPNHGRDQQSLAPRMLPIGPSVQEWIQFQKRKQATARTQRKPAEHRPGGSGIIGIYQRGDAWCAYIKRNGRRSWLGSFATKEAAIAARRNAEQANPAGGA